jgi:hypothetical protein
MYNKLGETEDSRDPLAQSLRVSSIRHHLRGGFMAYKLDKLERIALLLNKASHFNWRPLKRHDA